ncbi:MAG TPA: metal-dependent hydrolase [Phycisphaerae bacterium]|nr:metal-dependent hydrolase [Phycisphaerae bacterium]
MPIKIIYHGHSCLEIHSGEHRIQLDPFYDSNPLADVKSDKPNPQYIFLSHAHFDHMDDAERIARRTGATILANYEIAEYFAKKNLKVIHMNIGGEIALPFGRAALVFAVHTSTFPDGAPGGIAGGWVIQVGGRVIYFAGDTALFGDMALFGRLWKIDLACLPIGDNFTMGPQHAVLAAEMLKAHHVLPIHYNTWPPIRQDAAAFGKMLKQKDINPVVLSAGQSFDL